MKTTKLTPETMEEAFKNFTFDVVKDMRLQSPEEMVLEAILSGYATLEYLKQTKGR